MSPTTNVARMMRNPLMQSSNEKDFFSLVLSECALFGVPPNALALFRDLHALLGHSEPLREKQIAGLAGPLVNWRTFPNQPRFDRVIDVERMAFHQRALIAFGGGRPGEMVGRAEIICALGNMIDGEDDVPPEYLEIYRWAAIDTLSLIKEEPKAHLLAKDHPDWPETTDEEVVHPEGRLYATYQEICTSIRRESVTALERNPINHPRSFLRPWAADFLDAHQKVRKEAELSNLPDIVKMVDAQVANIKKMFPELGTFDEELDRRQEVVVKTLTEVLS